MDLKQQIGGNHYKIMNPQPVEVIRKWNLNFFLGNVLKYISRDKEDKLEDLKKAKQYLQWEIDTLEEQKIADKIKDENKSVRYDNLIWENPQLDKNKNIK